MSAGAASPDLAIRLRRAAFNQALAEVQAGIQYDDEHDRDRDRDHDRH